MLDVMSLLIYTDCDIIVRPSRVGDIMAMALDNGNNKDHYTIEHLNLSLIRLANYRSALV